MIIYLERLLPIVSSDLPESRPGRSLAFYLALLRMGFTYAPFVTERAVVSYTAFPPLPLRAVYFCCTCLGVTSTGRYPASCPAKPGLSSPDTLRISRDHLSYLYLFSNYTLKQLPPTNSLASELLGILSLGMLKKYPRNFSNRCAS